MPEFTIYPAIDLRRGQVVRLQEGDPNRQTQYGSDPAGAARRWLEAGAHWLHVVNLDGAFGEAGSENFLALQAILAAAQEAGAQVQFGGGLRTLNAVQAAFQLGVTRVVLGTAVIEQPTLLPAVLQQWGAERVAAGLDARDGLIQVRGWQAGTPIPALELAQRLSEQGLRWLVFTDIARDGLQTGLNLSATLEIARTTGLNVIASGGVAGWEDIHGACQAHLAGAIVGRALYEGKFNPQELFKSPC